ncbi:hypothetical protein [Aminobacter sp. MSH1]|uniref:hypothetical protein n=1 Tax=Aminobacter sp. MSH1 TaxID=374606 RepID=UPI000D3C9E28|nr:hypothetical protein [Aminobacter sp. MSH1]
MDFTQAKREVLTRWLALPEHERKAKTLNEVASFAMKLGQEMRFAVGEGVDRDEIINGWLQAEWRASRRKP